MEKLIESIKRHEGYKDTVYFDTKGYLTCGWGHQFILGSKIPLEVSELFFKSDLADAISNFNKIDINLQRKLNPGRRRVVVEMIFNMGLKGVLEFKQMWACIKNEDFEGAAREMLASQWASQVKGRADELAGIMRNG
jgi:lysozyme